MIPDLYPAATWEPVSYAGEASLMSHGSIGWVEHVVVGNGDPHGGFEHAPPGNRRFSHLWFAKDGRVRQYQDLRHDSWAQADGNDSYWSCETEGQPSEALTDAQLDALAAWHVWSGTDDAIATIPGQRGIGTHEMGGAAWGNHRCPGQIRAAQRGDIIRRARIIRAGGDDMQLSELAGWDVSGLVGLPPKALNFQTLIARVYTATVIHPIDPAVLAAAIAKSLPAGSGADPHAIAAEVVADLTQRLAT